MSSIAAVPVVLSAAFVGFHFHLRSHFIGTGVGAEVSAVFVGDGGVFLAGAVLFC